MEWIENWANSAEESENAASFVESSETISWGMYVGEDKGIILKGKRL